MPAALTINGVSASVYGLVLANAPSWLDSPSRTFQTVTIPGRQGVTPLAAAAEGVKQLTLRGTIMGSSATDARDKLDALKVALRTGAVTVSLSDRPTREIFVDLASIVVTADDAGSLISTMLTITINLQCSDPLWYDTTFDSIPVASGASAAIPLGTGPVRPLLTLMGPSTNPVISLYDVRDDLAQRMVFNGLALSTGDALVVDCDAVTIQINGMNAVQFLTGGNFFLLEPHEIADFSASGWPTIALTGGGTLSVVYRRAWR